MGNYVITWNQCTSSHESISWAKMSELATIFNCDHCENSFSKEKHLRKHYKKSHFRLGSQKVDSSSENDEKYECMDCGKKFRKRRHLNQHTEEHIDAYENDSVNTEPEEDSIEGEEQKHGDNIEIEANSGENMPIVTDSSDVSERLNEGQIGTNIQQPIGDESSEETNTAKTSVDYELDTTAIKQEKSIVIDDAAFEQLENDLSAMITDEIETFLEESEVVPATEVVASSTKKRSVSGDGDRTEKQTPTKKSKSESETKDIKVEAISLSNRRSTRTPISYNEGSDGEDEKALRKSSNGKSKEKKV